MDASTVDAIPVLTGVSVRTLHQSMTRCTYCLAEMRLAGERFTRYYDALEPGLAQYVHDIIAARSDR